MSILSRERQKEAEARARAATKGPWEDGACAYGPAEDNAPTYACVTGFRENVEDVIAEARNDDRTQDSMDMEFIAHVRTDAPDAYETLTAMEEVVRWAAEYGCERKRKPEDDDCTPGIQAAKWCVSCRARALLQARDAV